MTEIKVIEAKQDDVAAKNVPVGTFLIDTRTNFVYFKVNCYNFPLVRLKDGETFAQTDGLYSNPIFKVIKNSVIQIEIGSVSEMIPNENEFF